MTFKKSIVALVAGLTVSLSVPTIGFSRALVKRHVAVGTISSIDNHQVVINERVKGKEKPMEFRVEPSTKEMGNMTVGSHVAVHYRTHNHQRIATSIRERGTKSARVRSAVSL